MAIAHRYSIYPKKPAAHLFEVSLSVANPDPAGQVFSLAAWIPGSYLIRNFARHIVAIHAESEGQEIGLSKTGNSSWLAEPTAAAITVVAEIYACDLSVRGAHLDTTHAYFNGSCVFLCVAGQQHVACELEILPPPEPIGREWRVVTSMTAQNTQRYAFGHYCAENYAELIDHPVEIGELMIGEFEAEGIPHSIAIRGQSKVDMGRICKDLSRICETHLQLLGKPADLDRYLFLLMVSGEGYGGLEHRWSSSLVCSRSNLPHRGEDGVTEGYRKFLGLCSHEYFHLWNVKRMRPEVFTPYDLRAESHTGLLWVFEGITSYYDDLVLLRSGLISLDSYLELLGQTITRVMRSRGRFKQSIEESSFDAWTKFYRQDANASNAIVSYYTKGSLVALALDLILRTQGKDNCSLDVVMRECWQRYGETAAGMPEGGLESIAMEASGLDLADFFAQYVRGTGDLPLGRLLADVGIQYHVRTSTGRRDAGGKPANASKVAVAWLGANLVERGGRDLFMTVHTDSPAEKAGLASGDIAVALDKLQLTSDNIDQRLREYHVGDDIILTVFRQDELMRFRVTLEAPPADTCYLIRNDDCTPEQESRRQGWLTSPG